MLDTDVFKMRMYQKYQIEEVRLKRESPVCMSEKILRFKKKLIK